MPDNRPDRSNPEDLIREFDGGDPVELLRWAARRFGKRLALCSSFGPESIVILHMFSRIGAPVRIFTLDTGRLYPETYALMERCEAFFRASIEVFSADPERVREMVSAHGINLFFRSPQLRRLCCEVRKVEPLRRALNGVDAWITGLRRDQSHSRSQVQLVERDDDHGGLIKLNPLADWTEEMVWKYVREEGLPYNELHDKGYRSIGCAPCTRPTGPCNDFRAGRWWWENGSNAKECGIHSYRRPGIE